MQIDCEKYLLKNVSKANQTGRMSEKTIILSKNIFFRIQKLYILEI